MSRNKKNSRRITVNDVEYRWRATGNDGYISVTIWPSNDIGPMICRNFPYLETFISNGQINGCDCRSSMGDQIVITNRIIRRLIDVAIRKCDYNPLKRGAELHLWNMDDEIDLDDAIRATD